HEPRGPPPTGSGAGRRCRRRDGHRPFELDHHLGGMDPRRGRLDPPRGARSSVRMTDVKRSAVPSDYTLVVSLRRGSSRSIKAVVAVSMLIASCVVFGEIAVQPGDCCTGRHPIVNTYDRPLAKVDMVLAAGDGQTFGALAQDPLLQRPGSINGANREYSYRAQRPLWSALAWAGSLGQPGL